MASQLGSESHLQQSNGTGVAVAKKAARRDASQTIKLGKLMDLINAQSGRSWPQERPPRADQAPGSAAAAAAQRPLVQQERHATTVTLPKSPRGRRLPADLASGTATAAAAQRSSSAHERRAMTMPPSKPVPLQSCVGSPQLSTSLSTSSQACQSDHASFSDFLQAQLLDLDMDGAFLCEQPHVFLAAATPMRVCDQGQDDVVDVLPLDVPLVELVTGQKRRWQDIQIACPAGGGAAAAAGSRPQAAFSGWLQASWTVRAPPAQQRVPPGAARSGASWRLTLADVCNASSAPPLSYPSLTLPTRPPPARQPTSDKRAGAAADLMSVAFGLQLNCGSQMRRERQRHSGEATTLGQQMWLDVCCPDNWKLAVLQPLLHHGRREAALQALIVRGMALSERQTTALAALADRRPRLGLQAAPLCDARTRGDVADQRCTVLQDQAMLTSTAQAAGGTAGARPALPSAPKIHDSCRYRDVTVQFCTARQYQPAQGGTAEAGDGAGGGTGHSCARVARW